MVCINTARRFLDRLGWPNTFQTFDDASKGRPLARVLHSARFDDVAGELQRLNDAGAGIFVCVNATDGKGRGAKNITRVRALFVDSDGTPSPPGWHRCPDIFVYRDAPGCLTYWHAYWLVGNVPLDRFTESQTRLAKHYRTDPAVKDLPRVMRIPGFIHRKAEPQEVYCHVVEDTQWKK